MIKILPNFLSKEDFKTTQNYIFNELSWTYNKYIAGSEKDSLDDFQFVHNFFSIRNPYLDQPISSHSHILKPILLKLVPFYLFRVKLNLRPRTAVPHESAVHTDFGDRKLHKFDQTTAIYYLNTNNGYTLFEDGTKIDSVENTMVLFDGNLKHSGVSCTDQKRRIVLNINYIPGWNPDGSVYYPD